MMNVSAEDILAWIQKYEALGPLPGFLLPLLEAFLPFLPLFAFILANVNAFGLWLGFLISWGGAVTGSFLVFLLVRKYGQERIMRFLKKSGQVDKMMNWMDRHGFAPVFLLLCFPFTPSAVVNVVAGLSRINIVQYLFAVMAGKMIMIFTISFIGHDVFSFIEHPWKTALLLAATALLWFVGKQVEKKLDHS